MAALREAHHRCMEDTPRAHGASRLDLHKEEVLLGLATAFRLNNFSLTSSQLRFVLKRRWDKDLVQPLVSCRGKRNRHHLSLRARQALAHKRAGPVVLAGANAIGWEPEKFIETHSFRPCALFQHDQKRVSMRGGQMAVKRVEDAWKSQTDAVLTPTSTVDPLVVFPCASGAFIVCFYVMRDTFGYAPSGPVDLRLDSAPRLSPHCHPRLSLDQN